MLLAIYIPGSIMPRATDSLGIQGHGSITTPMSHKREMNVHSGVIRTSLTKIFKNN